MREKPDGIAFFDVDDTLLRGSSGVMLARLMLVDRGERVEPSYAIAMIKAYLQSKAGTIEYNDLLERGNEKIVGRSLAEMEHIAQECFDKYMIRSIYRGGVREVRMHQRRNIRVVLLTASLQPLIDPLAEFLGVDEAIATKLIFKDGVATGGVMKPYCYEDGKRVIALEYAERFNIPLKNCWFYSDSSSDLPLMEVVGNPVPTNPDPVLRRIGFRKNWKMKFFHTVLPPRRLPPR